MTVIGMGRINEQGQIELGEPTGLQPGIVRIIVESVEPQEEIEDDARWSASFARSKDVLQRMAVQARQEYLAGETEELDLDELDRDCKRNLGGRETSKNSIDACHPMYGVKLSPLIGCFNKTPFTAAYSLSVFPTTMRSILFGLGCDNQTI